MSEKYGRNDPCPCGSGKKYKNCCLGKQEGHKTSTLAGKRKFTAKLISGGGMVKPQAEQTTEQQIVVDYNLLMERSFGEAIHSQDEKPPVPSHPYEYLPSEEKEL